MQVPPLLSVGRKRKRWDEFVISRYNQELNALPLPENVGKASKQRRLFNRDCGVHFAFITVEAAHKPRTDLTWQNCKLCCQAKTKASRLERDFAYILREQLPHAKVITQPVVLGKEGAVDFLIISYRDHEGGSCTPTCLLVEIDGSQHMLSNMYNTGPDQQEQRDRRKDTTAFTQGFKLLRLYERDQGSWQGELKRAWSHATQHPETAFVFYSEKYRKYLTEKVQGMEEKDENICPSANRPT